MTALPHPHDGRTVAHRVAFRHHVMPDMAQIEADNDDRSPQFPGGWWLLPSALVGALLWFAFIWGAWRAGQWVAALWGAS